MRNALYASAAVLALAAFGTPAAFAQSRDTIQVAGSSTVLPFASIVAEEFGAVFPEFNTPVVGSGGTLEAAGLIPQPAEKTAEVLAAFEAGAQ